MFRSLILKSLLLTEGKFAAVRNRLWNNAGLFFIAWASHYFPFFLMNRQLFIHHYLPAHLCSALVAGAVLNFIASETINFPVSIRGRNTRLRPTQYSDIGVRALIAVLLFSGAMVMMMLFIAPLTYGTPGFVVFLILFFECFFFWTPF